MGKFEGPKSPIDKFVIVSDLGDKEPVVRGSVEEYAADKFADQKIDYLKGLERPATPEELRIFEIANRAVNQVVERYGASPFDVPARNIHPIRADKWRAYFRKLAGIEDADADYDYSHSTIVYKESKSRLIVADCVAHEMVHLKAFQSLEIASDPEAENIAIASRRSGLDAMLASKDGEDRYAFSLLDEAITTELELRALAIVRQDPLFKSEVDKVDAYKRKDPDIASGDLIAVRNGWAVLASYVQPRAVLNKVIDALYGKNRADFKDREEVFALFARAALTGKMLVLARVIEKTFGPGMFRKLGECQTEDDLEEFVESL